MNPVVSVVMPLYNNEREVARTVCSVLNQKIQDFELIVVDDGSTDAGPGVVRGFGDSRIQIVPQGNAGVSAARNRGIEMARSDIVAFLDADDEWHPNFLKIILDLTEKFPDCSVFATSYWIANFKAGNRRAVLRGLPPNFEEGILERYFEVALSSDPPLCSSTIAVRRPAIKAIGGFPVGVATGEDLLTWARLAVAYNIAYSITPLAIVWEPEEISSRPGRVPETPDRVGEALAQLIVQCGSAAPPGIADYLGHWHRMRGVIFLRLGDSRRAMSELATAMHLAGMRARFLMLFAISLLPGPGARLLYDALKRLAFLRMKSD